MVYEDPKNVFNQKPVSADDMGQDNTLGEEDMPQDQFGDFDYGDDDNDNDAPDRDDRPRDRDKDKDRGKPEEEPKGQPESPGAGPGEGAGAGAEGAEAAEGAATTGAEAGATTGAEATAGAEGAGAAAGAEGAAAGAGAAGAESAAAGAAGAAGAEGAAAGAAGAAGAGAAAAGAEGAAAAGAGAAGAGGAGAAGAGAGASTGGIACVVVAAIVIIIVIILMVVVGAALITVGPVEDANADTNTTVVEGKVPLYKQWDSRWGSNSYGCGTTIAQAGCGVTSLAMLITYWSGKEVLPSETAKISLENGWRICGSGTAWAAMTEMPRMYGLKSRVVNWQNSKEYLDKGIPVIQSHSSGYFTGGGHFIVVTGKSGNNYLINDPDGFHRTVATEAQILASLSNGWVLTK